MFDQKITQNPIISIFLALVITCLLLTACGTPTPEAKSYTIGIVNYNPSLQAYVEGFETGMKELGYMEGENITYIYNGALKNDPQVIAAEVKSLIDQGVDLLFTLGTPPTVAAKQAVEGTDIAVVFDPISNPVGEGVVADLSKPGGNVTGVQIVVAATKALEWLTKISPETTEVHVPHNPADAFSVRVAGTLPEAAATLGIQLILDEVTSNEQEISLVESLPENAAILFVPSPSLDAGRGPVLEAAIERGIVTGGYNRSPDNLVFTYKIDEAAQGRQAARLASQIFNGTKPGDLPVETGEFFLTINLKTADTIGLTIADDLLGQADTIVR